MEKYEKLLEVGKAQGDTNFCTVISTAVAFDKSFDEANQFLKAEAGRRFRSGPTWKNFQKAVRKLADDRGWEIKTYNDWYRNPLIEVACLSGVGDTMWLKDERIKIICLNHFGWLHIYNAEKMRAEWKKGTFEKHAYEKQVDQEDSTHQKRMQFFSIKDTSELKQHFTEWDNDHLRWNMKSTFQWNPDNNPYMCSIPMQKRVAPLPKKINLKLLRTVFKAVNKY